VYSTAAAVVVALELPGTAAAAVRIVVEDGVLVVEGVKGPTVPPAGRATVERFLRVERSDGPFRRALRLPCPVDASRGRARLEDGVLTVILPRGDR
jgi:HSP20 family protein